MDRESPGAATRAFGLIGLYGRPWLRALEGFVRSSPLGAVSLVVLVALGLVAIFAPQIAPYDPADASSRLLLKPPSPPYLLGTDHIGRDVLSRIIFGARVSMLVAFISIAIGDGLGFMWGVLSGYTGGKFDLIGQRLIDVLLSLPTIILALILVVALGGGLQGVILAIAVTRVPRTARVMRSSALAVKEMPYVEAARAIGASPLRIMALHVAPQCVAPLLVVASFGLGLAIFAEAALSFLGLGVPPPHPTWGNMLGGVLAEVFKPPWWLVIFPGVAITLTVLAFNFLGDALRDYLDPRLRGRLQ